MTKKDFEQIADVLRYAERHATDEEEDTVRFVTARLCDELAVSYPRFSPSRFLFWATREPQAVIDLCNYYTQEEREQARRMAA